MKFFDKFDKVYCVNLKHREDRKNNILNECVKYDLGEIDFFEAFNGNNISHNYKISNGNVGLIMSNIEIIKEAKNNGYKNILVIEDDCYFTDEIKNIDSYIDLLPEDWDMFYLGGNHNGVVGSNPPIKINEKIVKLHHTFTTHFVAINNTVYDVLLERLSTFVDPIDVIYTTIQKTHNVYCTSETIAKQINGYSDIENRVVDYHWLIK
jgi:cytochrome b involved in lipid metabolism